MKDYLIPNFRRTNPYETHQAVVAAFPDTKVLWGHRGSSVIVRSSIAPVGDIFVQESPTYYPTQGQTVEFLLVGNACVQGQRIQEDGTIKRRTLQYFANQEAQLQFWLYQRAHANGFAIVHLEVDSERPVITRKGSSWNINTTSYSGALEVIDVVKFTNALNQGLGRTKAFGFGLITTKPL